MLILAIFIACKIPYLHYAFYWDESWPYSAALKEMYKHGPSLLPGAIDPDYSKGHPLFFHSIAAVWMNIFGTSNTALHSFALSISSILLCAIYEIVLKLFNLRAAILATLLTALQVIFFVQSSFILPEILIALLALLSIFFYSRGQYLFTSIFLTALFFSKETGLVVGIVLGIDALIRLFNTRETLRLRLLRGTSILIPTLLIISFFLLQKQLRGWYFFPEHTGMIVKDWNLFFYNFKLGGMVSSFTMDDRYYYYLLLPILGITAAWKLKNYRYLLFVPLTGLVYLMVDDIRSARILPGIPFFLLFAASVLFMLYTLIKLKIFEQEAPVRFTALSIAFIFCFFCFSALNFYTPRYILIALIPLLIFVAVLAERLMAVTYRQLFIPIIIVFLFIGGYSFITNKGNGDCNLGAYAGVRVQQKIVDYMESHNYYDKFISCGSFLERQNLLVPATGYLRNDRNFKNTAWEIYPVTELAIFDNFNPDYRWEEIRKDTTFKLSFRATENGCWAEIYERIH